MKRRFHVRQLMRAARHDEISRRREYGRHDRATVLSRLALVHDFMGIEGRGRFTKEEQRIMLYYRYGDQPDTWSMAEHARRHERTMWASLIRYGAL